MTTYRNELKLGDGERLPWLETAEEYDTRRRRGWGTVVASLLAVIAFVAVIGGIWYTQRAKSVSADGELIAAPAGDYKVRAPGNDGMRVGNESDAMLAASEGEEASARIAAGGAALRPSTIAVPAGTTVDAPPTIAPTSAPVAATGAAVQLGAFDSEAVAEEMWARMSNGRAVLATLPHSVERVVAGGKTVFRLRAAVADGKAASALCDQLQRAKIACFAVR